jgi:ornithine--oxo-acid transaminase
VIVCDGNFHGRTITIVSFSTDPGSKRNFGPLTPGFEVVPYGDADALEAAIDEDTVAFLVEPIQGEAGVVVPPDGYLTRVREICTARSVLMIADEIQTGLGRTGTTFAVEHEGVRPDMFILGKALAGGIVPLSAVVADQPILGVFKPGEHGSTFGGNPIACAIGREVLRILRTGEFQEASRTTAYMLGPSGRIPRSRRPRPRPGRASTVPGARRTAERLLEAASSRRTHTRARSAWHLAHDHP